MLESTWSSEQLILSLVAALQALPEVDAELVQWEVTGAAPVRAHDAEVNLCVAGKAYALLIEVKKEVFPRDARQMIWQAREASGRGRRHNALLPLLAAESISPGAKELLREERVGYYDSGGSLFLPAPGAYLYIEKPPPKGAGRAARALFAGRRAQVLHALLVRRREWFGVTTLAQQAMVSPATVSQVLTQLERFDWLESRGQGPNKERCLRDPSGLLDAWAKQLSSERSPSLRRYFVPANPWDHLLKHMGHTLEEYSVEYAITHEVAAQRETPFLSNLHQIRVRLRTGPHADAAFKDLGARLVVKGANLTIIEAATSGELLFRERIDGLWYASPIQIYLDLLRGGEGRAKELADHFRKERIGY